MLVVFLPQCGYSILQKKQYTILNKFKINVQKGDAGLIGNFYFGLYEFDDSAFLLHYLKNSDTLLDVGANQGHFSIMGASVIGCNAIAIEPVPATYKNLQTQIDTNNLNGKINALNVGVSDKNGQLFFTTHLGTMNRIILEPNTGAIEIKVLTIDEIVSKEKIQVMKMDVEGWEKNALAGATTLLSNNNLNVIILELNGSGNKFGFTDEEVYDLIISAGFKTYQYDPFNRSFSPLNSFNKQSFNTIFIRDIENALERVKTAPPFNIWGEKI